MTALRLSSALLLCTALTGCFVFGMDRVRWTEDVELRDGTIVNVARSAKRYSLGPDGRGTQTNSTFSYARMKLSWEDDSYQPLLAFDVVDGTAYLVGHSTKESCRERPGAEYAIHIWASKGDGFQEVKESEAPLDGMRMNLLQGYWGSGPAYDVKGHANLREKALRDTHLFNQPLLETLSRYHLTCSRPIGRQPATGQ